MTTQPAKQLSPEEEGRESAKVMRECFKSFGLSDAEANKKIGALITQVQQAKGSFLLIRVRDVVYSVSVAGVNQVEIHAMPGGRTKQDDKYRVKKLEQTLPNILAILKEMGASVIYTTMPKKEAKPYEKMMEQFGFTKIDIPEETGAVDLIAYVVRVQ